MKDKLLTLCELVLDHSIFRQPKHEVPSIEIETLYRSNHPIVVHIVCYGACWGVDLIGSTSSQAGKPVPVAPAPKLSVV